MNLLHKLSNVSTTKHSKLGEGWEEHRDPYKDGVIFKLKYLGTHLVEEPPSGKKYTDGCSSEAIKAIIELKNKSGAKSMKIDLLVKSSGITIFDPIAGNVIAEAEIQRISFCTSDRRFPRVFAFFARNNINETMQCYSFSCKTPTQANEVSHAVHQAFLLAQEELTVTMTTNDKKASNSRSSNAAQNKTLPHKQDSTAAASTCLGNRKNDWISFDD